MLCNIQTDTPANTGRKVVRGADGRLHLVTAGFADLRAFFTDGRKETDGKGRTALRETSTSQTSTLEESANEKEHTSDQRRISPSESATRGHFTQRSYENERRFRERNHVE